MECPKCGMEIDDKALTCPNCKKVLKLICPVCNAINTSNTCHKCGYVIVNKCHQCGKINQTAVGKCPKCGFDTHVSAILQGSNIEEFAGVTLSFQNIKDVKSLLGSKKLYDKFLDKLNGLIYDYTKSIGLKRGLLGDDTYIIRFNKDYTYAASVKNAMKSSIELLNLITKLNYKLLKSKDFVLKCNLAIIKRSAYSSNDDYKSGVNINMIYSNESASKLLSNLQLIADGSVYEILGNTYPMDSIGMTRVKDKNLFLYQLDLTNYVQVEFESEEDEQQDEISIPDLIEEGGEVLETEDSIYDMDGISFNEINCEFTKEMAQGLSAKLAEKFQKRPKSIVVLKGKRDYQPRVFDVIEKIRQTGVFKSIMQITCYDEMKFKPYAFFSELVTNKFAFSSAGVETDSNDFSKIQQIERQGFLADTINMNAREFPHPEDVRAGLFEIFEKTAGLLQNTLLVIENIEKIDDTSFEILQTILRNFDRLGVSYLIVADKDFSLHKSAHFLLSKREYNEISLQPTPIKELIEANLALCKNVLNTFYMKKISMNTKGSQMFFMQALIYLMDLEIFTVNKGSLELSKSDTVLFPTTLDELIQLRLNYIKSLDANLFRLLASILLIGPQSTMKAIKLLDVDNIDEFLMYLENKGFIFNSGGVLQVQNYDLYYNNVISVLSDKEKTDFSNHIVTSFFRENKAHPVLAKLYEFANNTKKEFVQWENLSEINRSLGDFSAYLNCSMKVLRLLNDTVTETTDKSIEDYKLEVFEKISNLLYKYTPEKISNITQVILDNLEAGTDDKKVINLCNKIMQGCLIAGNYSQALLMAHKMLSRFEKAGTDPKADDFSPQALLVALIRLEILFNVGDLEDCISSGTEIFEQLQGASISSLAPKTVTTNQFEDLLKDSAGYVIFAKTLQLKPDIKEFYMSAKKIVRGIPDSYNLFMEIDNLLHGKTANSSQVPNSSDRFGETLHFLINAFSKYGTEAGVFASEIYHAKLKAKEHNLNQIELFCDLMIGKAYMNRDQDKKASAIFSSVLETAQSNGLRNLFYLAAYSTAELSLKNEDVSTAYGIMSNTIIELEKSKNKNNYLLMLFKLLYAKVLKARNEENQAEFCLNQAKQIAQYYNIKLNINTNTEQQ